MSEPTKKAGESLVIPSEYAVIADEPVNVAADVGKDATAEEASGWSLVRELLETIVLSLVIFFVIRIGVQNYRIESHSMQPTFYEGQFVLVNKLAYRLGEPARGDVVVFRNPDNNGEDYIKRVIGLPGDTLRFQDGHVYVNDGLIDDSFTNQPTYANSDAPLVISPDHIFVMGDNRPNSRDSRVFGQLEEGLLVGKAWFRIWPLNVMGLVDHYPLEPGAALAPE